MANLTPQQATRQAMSAQWALNQLGARNYLNLCQRFIENAYGTSGQYRSAAAASNALMSTADPNEADIGDLVFFRPDPSNGGAGHVGIYLGNGEMVSATNGGITRDNILTNGYWKNLLVGFGDPPPQWKGQSDQSLVQGASSLLERGAAAVGDVGRAVQAKTVAAWGGAGKYLDLIASAAQKYGIPINLLAAKVNVESGGNPTAGSPAGARGLLQLMPGTARALGVTDITDPAQNIDAGARYFKQMYDQQGNWEDALRAYNAGPNGNWNNAETRGHVTKVMKMASEIGSSISAGGGGMPGSGFGGPGGGPPGSDEPPEVRRQREQGNPPPPNLAFLGNLWEEFRRKFGAGLGSILSENADARQRTTRALVEGGQRGMQVGDTSNPFLQGIAGQEARDTPGPGPVTPNIPTPAAVAQAGGTPAPGSPGTRPAGWTDPNTVPEAYRGIVGASNDMLEEMERAREAMRNAPNEDAKYLAQKAYDSALQRWGQIAPSVAQVVQAAQKSRQGEFVPGTNASQQAWTIIKQDPVTGAITTETIQNPNVIQSDAQTAAAASNRNAEIAAAASRYGSDQSLAAAQGNNAASRYAADQGLAGTRESAQASRDVAGINARTQLTTTGMTTDTQRVTAALSAAVQQQQSRLDAQIRAGELSLREATERFNQWYKQNVEAPLAILQQKRETERYKLEAQNAITQRATGQSEHERGVANIGQQMWNTASDAYAKMIPLTVGEGWGQGFQQNLTGQGYTPNQGATYNTPESLDAFATRKTAEMLAGISPYAQNILAQQNAMGNPGQAMGGDQMSALQNQATGVASNALANPFQMPQQNPIQMPPPLDIGSMATTNSPTLTPGMINQYLPDYSSQAGSGYGRG